MQLLPERMKHEGYADVSLSVMSFYISRLWQIKQRQAAGNMLPAACLYEIVISLLLFAGDRKGIDIDTSGA